jgi:hypothetical protein
MRAFRSRLLGAAIVLVVVGAGAAIAEDSASSNVSSGGGEWGMRPRVCIDSTAGVSFRYPYDYFVRDQYKAEIMHGYEPTDDIVRQVMVDGKLMRIKGPDHAQNSLVDVREFSTLAKQLPSALQQAALGDIGNSLTGQTLTWTPFDYYRKSPDRPQGNPSWAVKSIKAVVGESSNSCALLCKHGDRYSGVVLTGTLAQFDNQKIIDSFEVLNGGRSSGSRNKPPIFTSWRESQGRAGKVCGSGGKMVMASERGAPAIWNDAWDLETAHYHITTQVSSERLLQYGQYLEALYKAYVKIYMPDNIPMYKMEIQIFNTHTDFRTAAAAHGFPVPDGVGGFFVPGLLAIFAYEQSNQYGGPSFSVEHVLAHECSHQFLHVTCNGSSNVPTWINEGLAVYFESGVFSNGVFEIRPPRERIERLKDIYQQIGRTLVPLDQYLGHYGQIPADSYGEVYAMTKFWLFGTCIPDPSSCPHKNCGLFRFRKYWLALKNHEDGTKAFDRIFMQDMIKAKNGDRQAAISGWQDGLLNFVKSGDVMRN